MGSGSLRELLVLEKIGYGGVYVTDPVVPTFCEPKLTAGAPKCVTVAKHEKSAILQAPDANRKMELPTVVHFGTLLLRRRRQLRILEGQDVGIADTYTFFVGVRGPDHGLWLAA